MCTAATYQTKDFYFGRTLDNEASYEERVSILPRNAPLLLRHGDPVMGHYAMIGISAGAQLSGDFPLFYDGVNEKGLSMAGLNFVGNAVYGQPTPSKRNLAQFEFVPWILGTCASVKDVRGALSDICLTNTPFSEHIPCAELHWIISDRNETMVVEPVAQGLMVYDNPVGVMTNNPPFPFQMQNLTNYLNLTSKEPTNRFSEKLSLPTYCKGMGAIGLPGDLSSCSRFVRAAFTRLHSVSAPSEEESVSQFFHILGSVEQQRGCCEPADGVYEITWYTVCYNATRGICYYTTYDNSQITAVDLRKANLTEDTPIHFPFLMKPQFFAQN